MKNFGEAIAMLVMMFVSMMIGLLLGVGAERNSHRAPQVISERISACEAKGGKYSYFYNDYSEKYQEGCEVKREDVTNF